MAVLFAALCASSIWLSACMIWSIRVPERRIWPPPRRDGFVQRLNGILGPASTPAVMALAILGWESIALGPWLRIAVGGTFLAAGACLSLAGVSSLGPDRTLGQQGELVETGPYRFSRNPQYVGAVLGYAGLALICSSGWGLAATAVTSVWLLLMPFAEEPWLRERLGAPYAAYTARVPRFLGFPRR